MRIVALDPGNSHTAWCELTDGEPTRAAKVPNMDLLVEVRAGEFNGADVFAIEMIASYGMAVGREVFETCLWIGRFQEAWEARGGEARLVYRRDVKLFLCESNRANDANIRAALIDRFGPGKDLAIGKKHRPGPLYGITGDEWSALAVAVTADGKPSVPPLFDERPRAPATQAAEEKPF